MSRSTVQRATSKPSRFSWAQTLRAPYTSKFPVKTRSISGFSIRSRFARADSLSGSARLALWSC